MNPNEAAFPRMSHTNCYGSLLVEQDGMTLRDYFAAKAMHVLYLSTYEYEFTGASRSPNHKAMMNELAGDAYDIADSMLKARDGNS